MYYYSKSGNLHRKKITQKLNFPFLKKDKKIISFRILVKLYLCWKTLIMKVKTSLKNVRHFFFFKKWSINKLLVTFFY